MTAVVSQPSDCVNPPFRNSFITPARPVRISSGISAKGRVKLRTTCERMRIFSGSRPMAMMMMAGMIVMKRAGR